MAPPKIMVVENEAKTAAELQEKLRAMGYAVTKIAETSEQAAERANRDKPYLAMIDVKLPSGEDGIDLAELLQERYRIPVIYVTSRSDEQTLVRAAQTYPLNYILEPYTDGALRAAIEMDLHRHWRYAVVEQRSRVLDTTLEALGGAMILTDENGFIRNMTSVAEALTGWKNSDAVNRPLGEIYLLRDEETGEMVGDPLSLMYLKSEIVPPSTRYVLISRNKVPIPVVTAVVGVNDPQGELDGVIVAFQDSSRLIMPEQFWNSYAANLHLSGLLLSKQGHYRRAEFCFKRALLIWELNLGSDNPKVSRVLAGLAELYENTGRLDESKQFRARAAALGAGVPLESDEPEV